MRRHKEKGWNAPTLRIQRAFLFVFCAVHSATISSEAIEIWGVLHTVGGRSLSYYFHHIERGVIGGGHDSDAGHLM
jgi:hypothetical protein